MESNLSVPLDRWWIEIIDFKAADIIYYLITAA